jgi:hypothetical protein
MVKKPNSHIVQTLTVQQAHWKLCPEKEEKKRKKGRKKTLKSAIGTIKSAFNFRHQ